MRLQRFEEPVAVVENLLPAGIRVCIQILWILAQRLHTLAYRARGLALLAQQRVHARVELLRLREPELMDLPRGHVGRGRIAQRHLVKRLALGQAPDPGVVHRWPPQLRQ
jgi:hypothetical protein